MTDKLRRFVEENGLLSPGDRVTCAVSGGADSMAMLWALYKLRDTLQIELSCAHYNHGLRDSADRDEAFVLAFCEKYGIPFQSEKGNVKENQRPGESTELAARRLRYDFLRRVSGRGKLATAHTADDNLETVLLRLCRGTSLRGLGGIPVRRDNIIRPLLFAEREDIMRFLAEEGVDYREDETNAEDFCPRNRIRHSVVPLLRQENPAVAPSVLSLSKTLREEDALLSRLAGEALDTCRSVGGWSCEQLNALDPALRRRALFAILQESGLETPAQSHLELLSSLAASSDPSGKVCFPGLILERRYDTLCVSAPAPDAIVPIPLPVPGTIRVSGWTVTCSQPHIIEKSVDSPTAFTLRYDMPDPGLRLRSRMPGDKLRLSGGSRSLKRLMIDRKIPAAIRAGVPVLTSGADIAAVALIGADVRFLANPGELAVEITIERG
ncbi:MAG: tRNA lysidine(34) synthetase TilS [Oscillospiraceae bacterium]|nr:tRNA lysidine(34) synthetase TilS [Oscillospiraceae bacterium]